MGRLLQKNPGRPERSERSYLKTLSPLRRAAVSSRPCIPWFRSPQAWNDLGLVVFEEPIEVRYLAMKMQLRLFGPSVGRFSPPDVSAKKSTLPTLQ